MINISDIYFQSFFSSLLIASSTMGVLLLGILTYVHKNYKDKKTKIMISISFFLVLMTNLSIIKAFYLTSELPSEVLFYPILFYFFTILSIIFIVIDLFVSEMLQTLKKRDS